MENAVALRMTLKVSSPVFIINMPLWVVFCTENKCENLLHFFFLKVSEISQHNALAIRDFNGMF